VQKAKNLGVSTMWVLWGGRFAGKLLVAFLGHPPSRDFPSSQMRGYIRLELLMKLRIAGSLESSEEVQVGQ
jgi:hypothetical protein